MKDIQHDAQAGGDADSEPGDVDNGKTLLSFEVSPGKDEVVFEHGVLFLIRTA